MLPACHYCARSGRRMLLDVNRKCGSISSRNTYLQYSSWDSPGRSLVGGAMNVEHRTFRIVASERRHCLSYQAGRVLRDAAPRAAFDKGHRLFTPRDPQPVAARWQPVCHSSSVPAGDVDGKAFQALAALNPCVSSSLILVSHLCSSRLRRWRLRFKAMSCRRNVSPLLPSPSPLHTHGVSHVTAA